MEHYVVIHKWASEYEQGFSILGVVHSLEEAKEIFNKVLTEERAYAKEHDFKIYEDEEFYFDAGEEGYYISNHTHLCVEFVKG